MSVARNSKTNDWMLAAKEDGATALETAACFIFVKPKGHALERLSIDEASDYCKCPPRKIREAVRAGELPASELSERAISILRADLEAWLVAHPARIRVVDVDQDDADDLADRLAAE